MRKLWLCTYGCQMNERDSEEVLGMLTAQGYAVVAQPEEADLILLNTCSVREHAEERAFGKMGMLRELKRQKPELVLGILGCMAKAQREEIFRRLPQVDLVAGPAELYDLPMLLAEIESKRRSLVAGRWSLEQGIPSSEKTGTRTLAVGRAFRPLELRPAGDYRRDRVSAFVTIMEGCDKRCAYCIVPFTRGQEISRPVDEVVAEVRVLAASGYKEVMLLGQNVNSYGKRFPDGNGYKGPGGRQQLLDEGGDRLIDFPVLLRRVDAETGIARLRFTTSHPFDAHERLFAAMAECGSVCEHLHLPVQSGSNRMLKAMRRGYTVEEYEAKIARLRALAPEIHLSTDIIVGFPGETEEDFEATRALMERVGYDSAFIFKYSVRPGTEAAGWVDNVPSEEKDRRNQALLALQERASRAKLERWVGRAVEELIERRNAKGQLAGRTRGNVNVVCSEGDDRLIGELVGVRVERVTSTTLIGSVV